MTPTQNPAGANSPANGKLARGGQGRARPVLLTEAAELRPVPIQIKKGKHARGARQVAKFWQDRMDWWLA